MFPEDHYLTRVCTFSRFLCPPHPFVCLFESLHTCCLFRNHPEGLRGIYRSASSACTTHPGQDRKHALALPSLVLSIASRVASIQAGTCRSTEQTCLQVLAWHTYLTSVAVIASCKYLLSSRPKMEGAPRRLCRTVDVGGPSIPTPDQICANAAPARRYPRIKSNPYPEANHPKL